MKINITMPISKSPHYKYANQTLDWLPMDTENRYQYNLTHSLKDLTKYNWVDSHFTYKFNSHGFRCDEFVDLPSVVFLGCSLTQGTGLPIEKTWATIVANKLNLKCYNLGIGGSSNDTAFRLAYSWFKIIKPITVILCTPPTERLELLSDSDNSIQLLPNAIKSHPGLDFYKHWVDNENNGILNKTKNTLAIENLCNHLSINLLTVDSNTLLTTMNIDLARDLSHPGIKSNQHFADYVLKQL